MSGKDKLELKTIWLGLTVALGFWFLSGIIALLWVIFSDAGVFHLGMFVYLLGIVGVLLGGAVAGIKAKYKGLVAWFMGRFVVRHFGDYCEFGTGSRIIHLGVNRQTNSGLDTLGFNWWLSWCSFLDKARTNG